MKRTAMILALVLLMSPLCALGASAAETSDAADRPEYNGYIVRLKDGADIGDYTSDAGEVYVGDNLYSTDNLPALVAMAGDSAVEYIEPDYIVKPMWTPDDYYYSEQWNLDYIGMKTAWDHGYYGDGVRVAVIDSGIYQAHPDFANTRFDVGLNLINGGTDTNDTYFHGTFVAGIIAASTNNALGLAGMAPGATLVPFKCFENEDGSELSLIVSAIYKAAMEYDCDVINLSLGSPESSKALEDAVNTAVAAGAILVAASGNDGTSGFYFPAKCPGVIGVGSIGNTGTDGSLINYDVSSYSQHNNSVFVSAPGASICGLYIDSSEANYVFADGTSFAAPHVAALAALAKCAEPEMKGDGFMELLKATVNDYGPTGYDTYYGWGVIDAAAFMEALTAADPVPALTPNSMSNFSSASAQYKGFPDVAESRWYGTEQEGVIAKAVGLGIMSGDDAGTFRPDDGIKLCEVMKMAAVVHSIYSGDAHVFDEAAGAHWYDTYFDYAEAAGIISAGEYRADAEVPSTRAQMAHIFSLALPNTELAVKNEVDLSYIPDIAEDTPFSADILLMYRAGVLAGDTGSHAYRPGDSISRAEAAAIVARIALPAERRTF